MLPPGIEGFSDGFADEIGDSSTGDDDPTTADPTADPTSDPTSDPTVGPGGCPDFELGSQVPATAEQFFDASQPSEVGPLCAAFDTAEQTLLWVAPTTGEYVVTLDSFGAPTTGSVIEGECGGLGLTCVASGTGPVAFFANAGQPYTFVIEGDQSTAYILSVDENQVSQSCPVGELFGPSDSAAGSTMGSGNEFGSDCGGFESSDQGWIFLPEVTGTYRIDTAGSNYDTILHVFDGVCGGPTLACNDDNDFNTDAILEVELQAGNAYTIVVDGFGGQVGDYQLAVDLLDAPPALCEGALLLPSLLPVALSWPVDFDFGDEFFGCSFAGGERRMRWIAPTDALVRVRQAAAPNFSALTVFAEGCAEGSFECRLAQPDLEPEIVLPVVQGQTLLIVSEYDAEVPGEVVFSIQPIVDTMGCGSPMPAGVPSQISGTTNGSGDESTGTCAFTPAPEREFWWAAPASGTYVIDTAGSNYDTLLYVRDGGCNGPELACNDDFIELESHVEVDLVAGQIISIFVDGFNGSGSFVLNISQG